MALKTKNLEQITAAIRSWSLMVLLFMFGCGIPVGSAIADSAKSSVSLASNFLEQPEDVSPERWAGLQGAVSMAELLPSPDGIGGEGDQFGYSVAIDGNRAIVGGAYMAEVGGVIVFENTGTGWEKVAVLRPSDGETEDFFGFSVSLSGDRALVGAHGNDDVSSDSGAVYIFELDGDAWVETAKLKASDGSWRDQFGYSVSLSGSRALIGAYYDDDQSGSAYVFEFNGLIWSETAKLTTSDGDIDDGFGHSVSLSGERALIGAQYDDDNGNESGSAYIFEFDGAGWSQTAKLLPSDGAMFDHFGSAVSLSDDRALVGSYLDDDSLPNTGSAYVFDFNGIAWYETAKLTASDSGASDHFGTSVSLSGNWALVSAYRDDDSGINSGAAYLYRFNGSTWLESNKLIASNGSESDFFGISVSLSGNSALVGAYLDDHHGIDSGSAYLFEKEGAFWSETANLTAGPGALHGSFGVSVSVSGSRALIGANDDNENGDNSGAAYVYEFIGSKWVQVAKLMASDGSENDFFGSAVSISGDRALVSASGPQTVYVFDFNGVMWSETAQLVASDGEPDDRFGRTLQLSGDRALIGAPHTPWEFGPGAAYIFDYDGSAWIETAKLLASDGESRDGFGGSVNLSGDRAFVGATGADINNGNNTFISNVGAVYIFELSNAVWTEVAKLTPNDLSGQFFGTSISSSDDRILIGASGSRDYGQRSGAAYMFENDGITWSQKARLIAWDGNAYDYFGSSVSLLNDRALIGAYGDDDNGAESGSAYLFEFNGFSWRPAAKITAMNGHAEDAFGRQVILFDDWGLIGAPLDDGSGTNSGAAYAIGPFPLFSDGFDY